MFSTLNSKPINKPALFAAGLCLAALTAVAADQNAGGVDHSRMDHSGMDHAAMGHGGGDHSGHQMDTTRDAEGRTLYGMKHKMDPELSNEIRAKIASFSTYSDAQLALVMDMMGPEYAWYVSPPEVKGDKGILILMHGFREQGDRLFKQQVEPLGNIFPTALGVGMAMMMSDHIQIAIDDLEKAGAKEIVVVPVTSTSTNELYRQWLYILGKQQESEYATVPRVKTKAKLRLIDPPGDNPLIAEALLDHASEISTDPSKEVVIIAGHGPSSAEDNAKDLKLLARIAKVVKEDGGFAEVHGMTLQDDAPPEVRAANVKKMRDVVEGATKKGRRVLVVTNLMATRSIQAKLRSDLKGLDFEFNAKGLSAHPNFMKWMSEAVREELDKG